MYIVRYYGQCSVGDTLDEAIKNFELDRGESLDLCDVTIYEAKEIEVERTFKVKEKQ